MQETPKPIDAQFNRMAEITALGIVLLPVMLLRVFYINTYLELMPYAAHPLNDARMYWDLSRAILQDGWLLPGEGPFYQAPLYPYILALLQHIGIYQVESIIRLQSFLGVITTLQVYLLARFMLPIRWSTVAALLFGLCHYPLFFESKVLAATAGMALFLLFALSYVLWLKKQKTVWLFCSAVIFSLSVLCRANLIFALPFIMIHIAWPWTQSFKSIPSLGSKTDWRGAITKAVIFLIIFITGILPVTLRNYFVGGSMIPISANSGVTLYMGTNSQAAGGLAPVAGLSNDIAQQKTGSIALASKLAGEDFSPSEASNFWVRKTADWIMHNPASFIILEGKKLLWSLYQAPPAVNYSSHFEEQWIAMLRWMKWFTAITVLIGLAGLPLLLLNLNRSKSFLVCLLGGYVLLCLVFYASDRFLCATLPFLAISGAYGMKRLVQLIYEKRKYFALHKTTLFSFMLWIIISASCVFNPTLNFNRENEIGMGWYNLGAYYEGRNNPVEALQAYENALDYLPEFPSLLLNLGVLYGRNNDLERSTDLFNRVLQIDPANQKARENLRINQTRQYR
jgi:dolichyl-phosphate-mannose-protein mannosyltransferase